MKLLKVELSEEKIEALDREVVKLSARLEKRVTRAEMVRLWIAAGCPCGQAAELKERKVKDPAVPAVPGVVLGSQITPPVFTGPKRDLAAEREGRAPL